MPPVTTLPTAETTDLSAADAELIRPFVTNLDRPVFGLRNLPEEVVAVLFAYYSRSRDPLRTNLVKLLRETGAGVPGTAGTPQYGLAYAEEIARRFHERWVVGYGHASVAEHAIAHLAVEQLSIIGTKLIEDCRLASYTEKSTRFVVFSREHFYPEPTLQASEHAYRYTSTCQRLLGTYQELMPRVLATVEAATPKPAGKTPSAHAAACRAKACDILRYLLPAAVRTNMGITVGARELAWMITKLASSRLAEGRTLGAALKAEGQQLIPTLLRHADSNAYLVETDAALHATGWAFDRLLASPSGTQPGSPDPADEAVQLIEAPANADIRLVTALLYGYRQQGYPEIQQQVEGFSAETRAAVVDEALRRRGPHDPPPRALEHLQYTFQILIDFGAYRDLQRHRICTQTPQLLGSQHGWSTPPEIEELHLGAVYQQAMEQAAAAHRTIARDYPYEAQYVLPLAFRKQVLLSCTLRELHHIIQLRSGRQGHPSYRTIAQAMFRAVERIHPLIAEYIRVDLADYTLARG